MTPCRAFVRHLGLTTPGLRGAEGYYREQFGIKVMFRETVLDDDEWRTLPAGFGWENAIDKRVDIRMVALSGPGFVLALFHEDALRHGQTVVGLMASPSSVTELRGRIAEGNDQVSAQSSGVVEVVDPMGITWQISDDDQFLSSGEMSGRWLRV